MTAYRYLRCLCQANGGDPNAYAIAEFTASITNGGANVLTGGVAAASSQFDPSFGPANAFDGNPNTSWASSGIPVGTWISYDLGIGNSADFVEFKLTARNEVLQAALQCPTQGVFQGSNDNATWNDILTFNTSAFGIGETKTFNFVPAAGIRASQIATVSISGLPIAAGIRASQLGVVSISSEPQALGLRASQLAVVAIVAYGQDYHPLGPVIGLNCWTPCGVLAYNGE